jgi:hypothetical protein
MANEKIDRGRDAAIGKFKTRLIRGIEALEPDIEELRRDGLNTFRSASIIWAYRGADKDLPVGAEYRSIADVPDRLAQSLAHTIRHEVVDSVMWKQKGNCKKTGIKKRDLKTYLKNSPLLAELCATAHERLVGMEKKFNPTRPPGKLLCAYPHIVTFEEMIPGTGDGDRDFVTYDSKHGGEWVRQQVPYSEGGRGWGG